MITAVNTPPDKPPIPAKKRKSGVVIPHRARWHQRLLARVVVALIRCVDLTIRYRLHDDSGLFETGPADKYIFAIWHNRLALSLMIYQRYVVKHAPERRMAAMVSASRDGGLLTRVLELLKTRPVRGSSSRRGPQALREMVSWAEAGYDLAITPDGPRGPRYQVQDGVISTAQLTGLPIIPVSYRLSWKSTPKSWDRFQIPLPFSRCDVYVCKPLRVPRETTGTERNIIRKELEQTLLRITRD